MNIVVIEDHKLVRDMLVVSCVDVVPGARAHGASTGEAGVTLCRELQPAVVFLDLALPDGDGFDFLPRIAEACASAKIIALTSHPDDFTIHRALTAEMHGFVDKNEQPLGVLREAVLSVLAGRRYLSPVAQQVHLAMRNDPADFTKMLSAREQELLTLFGAGLENDEIATRLGLSAGTVKLYRIKIMNKLNLHSTPQLMRYALEKGFTRIRSRVLG